MSSSPTAASNEYTNLGPEDLARLADQFTWFHAIDCGDFQTSGRFKPGTPQNRTLYGVFDLIRQMDLRGQNCLDIGTADGLLAFGMKTLGAETVIASDTYRLKSFDLACAAIGAAIDYRPWLQIKDLLATFQPASFDLIACAGIIYHMLNPLSALLVGRQLVKEGGYFLVESAYAPGGVCVGRRRNDGRVLRRSLPRSRARWQGSRRKTTPPRWFSIPSLRLTPRCIPTGCPPAPR